MTSAVPPSSATPPAGASAPQAALRVRNLDIAGPHGRLPLRLYQPAAGALLPLVLYLHGGRFVGGSLDDADPMARHIAGHLPAVVVSVDYALAPARPFPAAPEDAYAALLWAAEHAASLGADDRRIAVDVRTPLLRFPDLVSVEVLLVDGNRSTLAILSRSVYGHSDLGTNRRRVTAWLDTLRRAFP